MLFVISLQLVIASAPGISTQHGQYGTPMVVAGLVLASAGTITFPSMLAYLCNQARTSVCWTGQNGGGPPVAEFFVDPLFVDKESLRHRHDNEVVWFFWYDLVCSEYLLRVCSELTSPPVLTVPPARIMPTGVAHILVLTRVMPGMYFACTWCIFYPKRCCLRLVLRVLLVC